MRNDIPFEEAEVFVEHGISEPDFCTSVKEDLIKVVSDTTSILHLADHIAHCPP